MRGLFSLLLATSFLATSSLSQDLNKVVFGPLEGDNAGVIRVLEGEAFDVEIWVRTDSENPAPFYGINHSLMTEDVAVTERDSATFGPEFSHPMWEIGWVDGPYGHDVDDAYPIPEGYTSESMVAVYQVFEDPAGDPLDTNGDWVYFGAFHMVCGNLPGGHYVPFAAGWYPHSGEGTNWAYEAPPGGGVIPQQDYAALDWWVVGVEDDALPLEFSLQQNYPNPFNASTTIGYDLPEGSDVSVDVFDVLGRRVETLVSGLQSAGSHSVVWDAGDSPSGIYFYRIEAGEYSETKSCLLLK